MPYRQPGIEIIQQFQEQQPALSLPTLPAIVVGPGYQVQDDVDCGDYDDVNGTLALPVEFPYTGLAAGAIVDLADLDEDELSSVQKPVSLVLKDVYTVVVDETGATTPAGPTTTQFNDASPGTVFAGINPGAVGAPTFYLQIISGTGLGVGDLALNLVVAKVSNTQLTLAREIAGGATAITYRILKFTSSVTIDGADFAALGITKASTGVSLPANLLDEVDGDKVALAEVRLGWRALRPDLAGVINVFTDLDSLEAVFGVGQVVPANILAYGVLTALDNTTTEVSAIGLDATLNSDEAQAYQEALDYIADKDVYAIAVCTQNVLVAQALSAHTTQQSASTVGRERIGFGNRKLKTIETKVPSSGTGTRLGGATGAAPNDVFTDTAGVDGNATFITDGVQVGYFLEVIAYAANEGMNRSIAHNAADAVVGATRTWTFVNGGFTAADVGRTLRMAGASNGANNGDHVIESVTSATVIVTTSATTPVNETFLGGVTQEIWEVTPTAAQDDFILNTRHYIASVDSETQITLEDDITAGFAGDLDTIEYIITRDMTRTEQAEFLAAYSTSFANRRFYNVWTDKVVKPISGTDTFLPGYFQGCALAGMVAGLPSQQGFTNLTLVGFTGREHGKDYFTDTQLNIIAGGGTLLLEQEVVETPLFVRHQLSTDLSSIYFQELSVTKNVDLIARFFRGLLKRYIGPWNITNALIDHLMTVEKGGIEYLKGRVVERAGPILIEGSIVRLQADPDQGDQVLNEIDIDVPLPFNYLKITLLV